MASWMPMAPTASRQGKRPRFSDASQHSSITRTTPKTLRAFSQFTLRPPDPGAIAQRLRPCGKGRPSRFPRGADELIRRRADAWLWTCDPGESTLT